MKTIEELSDTFINRLFLYKAYEREYVNPLAGSVILLYLVGICGFILFGVSGIILSQVEYAEATGLDIFAGEYIAWSGIIFALIGFIAGAKVKSYVKIRRKKLQLAFEMEHEGKFDDIFDIDDNNPLLKMTKKKWVFGEQECENTKASQKQKKKS